MLIIVGIVLGLLSATISESFFHMFFGHPFESVKRIYFKNTKLFAACLKPYYHHYVIHHKKTYLNHFFSQFDSKEHKKKVDEWIEQNFSEDFKNLIFKERYNLTLKGFVGTLPFAGPFCLGPALIWYFLGFEAFLGSLLTGYIPLWMSKYIHPLIHAPQETHLHGPFIQWLMKTTYAEKILLNHFLHHNDGDKNFNLFLGGDRLIGLHRNGTAQEMAVYQELLKEFRLKVRAKDSIAAEDLMAAKSTVEEEVIKDFLKTDDVTTNERFEFQKKLFACAENNHSGHWDYENFGFSLYSKKVDYKEWTKRKEFSLSGYRGNENEVEYRDQHFRSGDILLTNQSSDADGLFSTLLDRDINFAHAAVFVNLTYLNGIFPSVLEINEYGTRAVPLKAFLSRDFNSYIEILRPNLELSKAQKKGLDYETKRFLDETHAFDIYQDRTQNHYLNCARTIELVYKRAGIPLEIGDSKYHYLTYPNLFTLGIDGSIGKKLLMPDDYALAGLFTRVGAIANGSIEAMAARNLTRAYFQQIWRTKQLTPAQFPMAEKIKGRLIEEIQKDNLASKLILSTMGMTFEEFPYGPATFMSLVNFGDNTMISAVKTVRTELEANYQNEYANLSWEQLLNHPKIQTVLLTATAEFMTIFSEYKRSENRVGVNPSLIGGHGAL